MERTYMGILKKKIYGVMFINQIGLIYGENLYGYIKKRNIWCNVY